MTEREVFEAYGSSVGWDLTRDEDGKYSHPVADYFRGWLIRADVQKAMEFKQTTNFFDSLMELTVKPKRGGGF